MHSCAYLSGLVVVCEDGESVALPKGGHVLHQLAVVEIVWHNQEFGVRAAHLCLCESVEQTTHYGAYLELLVDGGDAPFAVEDTHTLKLLLRRVHMPTISGPINSELRLIQKRR
jgi:hypothetical protein